jgi:hypothetical protein
VRFILYIFPLGVAQCSLLLHWSRHCLGVLLSILFVSGRFDSNAAGSGGRPGGAAEARYDSDSGSDAGDAESMFEGQGGEPNAIEEEEDMIRRCAAFCSSFFCLISFFCCRAGIHLVGFAPQPRIGNICCCLCVPFARDSELVPIACIITCREEELRAELNFATCRVEELKRTLQETKSFLGPRLPTRGRDAPPTAKGRDCGLQIAAHSEDVYEEDEIEDEDDLYFDESDNEVSLTFLFLHSFCCEDVLHSAGPIF